MTDDTEAKWAEFLSMVKACKPEGPKGQPLCYCDSGGKTILQQAEILCAEWVQ